MPGRRLGPRRPASRRSLLLLTALVVVIVLSGCATEPHAPDVVASTAAEPQLGPIRVPTDPSQVVRPIDQYLPGPQVVLQLVRAERRQEIECLRGGDADRVIEWPLDEAATLRFLEGERRDAAVRSALWGFFDPESASRLGYSRSSTDAGATASGLPIGATYDEFSTCAQSTAEAFPLGEDGGAFAADSPSSLPDGGPTVPTGDSRVEAAVEAWSACMTKRGFDYPDPVSAEFDPRWRGGTSPVTPEQIATATADMDCKAETNLVGIELAVQSAYDQEYIESHREALENMAEVIADYIGDVPDDEKR